MSGDLTKREEDFRRSSIARKLETLAQRVRSGELDQLAFVYRLQCGSQGTFLSGPIDQSLVDDLNSRFQWSL